MSVLLQGWGVPFAPLTQGYGAAAPVLSPGVILRETFAVPLPDGEVATRLSPHGDPPYVGSAESGIAFALDFRGWLGAAEHVSSLSVSAFAFPVAAGTRPSDVSGALVQATVAVGTQAIVTLHAAQAQTFYVLTVSATTSTGRVLECRMPRLWCPD